VVPIHAVFAEGRERYCYVPAQDGRVKAQTVRIGKANETYVEIREGLKEGDRVLLRKPKPGEVDEQGGSSKAKEKAKDAAPDKTTPDKATPMQGDPSKTQPVTSPNAEGKPAGPRKKKSEPNPES